MISVAIRKLQFNVFAGGSSTRILHVHLKLIKTLLPLFSIQTLEAASRSPASRFLQGRIKTNITSLQHHSLANFRAPEVEEAFAKPSFQVSGAKPPPMDTVFALLK